MRITDLIEILHEHLSCYGDREVFHLDKGKLYPITYLGSGSSECGEYFWMTSVKKMEDDIGEPMDEFKAPAYQPDLKIVK